MNYKMIIAAAAAAMLFAGCAKEVVKESPAVEGENIIATAVVPGAYAPEETKVAYTDKFKEKDDIVDITAAWEEGDTFKALEINGSTVKEVTFTAKGSGKSAVFSSKGADKADDNTQWVAAFGNVEIKDGQILCKYDGQDGTLENISKYDYSYVTAKGSSPKFDFSKGARLTYLMRVILPAGIKTMEFNTGEVFDGGWQASTDGKVKGTTSTCVRGAVKTLTLKNASTDGQVAYLAMPAIDYTIGDGDTKNRLAGIIITIMSSDMKLSQGKTLTKDFSLSGGCLGTFDMSTLKLIPRPLVKDAIKLGNAKYDNVTYNFGSWAPFNLGADYPTSDDDIKGAMFAWGETEPKESFSREGYKYYEGGTYKTQIGYKYIVASEKGADYIHLDASGGSSYNDGPGTYYDIRGTKYDAARVKWGIDWCLPSNDIANNIAHCGKFSETVDKDGKMEILFFAAGKYKNTLNFTSAAYGAVVFKANGAELALYSTPFTDNGKLQASNLGRYYTSTTDYGVLKDGTPQNYWNRSVQIRFNTSDEVYINNKSWQWDGLSIRPILNEDE